MTLILALLVTLSRVKAESGDFLVVSGLELGPIETVISTEEHVYHISSDDFIPGNLLLVDGYTIKTTNGKETFTLAGDNDESVYENGRRKLGMITGFYQHTPLTVFLVDHSNHCIHILDRLSNRTSVFAGNCMKHGYKDGVHGSFYRPWAILDDVRFENRLLVTDVHNHALRSVDIRTKKIETIHKRVGLYYPRGMCYDMDRKNLYIINNFYITKLSLEEYSLTIVTGRKQSGFADGLIDKALFRRPRELCTLTNNVLAVTDYQSHALRIVDLDSSTVTSVCSGKYGNRDGTYHECQLHSPRSLHCTENSVYIGGYGSIKKLAVAKRKPTSPSPTTQTMTLTTSAPLADVSTREPLPDRTKTTFVKQSKTLKRANLQALPGRASKLQTSLTAFLIMLITWTH